MDSYRELRVWQSAMQLARVVYLATDQFPQREVYGLAQQLRRAAVSVPSNIAEGKGRFSKRDFAHFLFQARGSLLELETQAILASDLGFIPQECLAEILENSASVGKSLSGLINSLRQDASAP